MTLDDALLWLHDRLGRDVNASITIERGDLELGVLEVSGKLRHWSEGKWSRAVSRDDVVGLYAVGENCALDLSDVQPLEIGTWPDDPSHLVVRLDVNTTLDVVEQEDLPDVVEREDLPEE
jgi:hypothetical protein